MRWMSFFLLLPTLVGAATLTNGDLLSRCEPYVTGRTSGKQLEVSHCFGYVVGYAEGATMGALAVNGGSIVNMAFCTPDTVTTDQMVRVIVRYLQQHPEQLHLSSAIGAEAALKEAFPCPRQ